MKKEREKEEGEFSHIFRKTAATFLVILGVVIVLITGNTITGHAIASEEILKTGDVIAAVWGLLITFTGIWIGFFKE